jgi:outer membrane protein assembly complex protein YaeT
LHSAKGEILNTSIPARYRPVFLVTLLALSFLPAQAQSAAPGQAQAASDPSEHTTFSDLGALSRYEGKVVRQIDFKGIAGTNPGMLRGLISVRENEPLERDQLRQSVKTLYATGRFATLEVEADPAPGGVALTYVAKENYFNGQVRVHGVVSAAPRANELVNASRLDLGELFSEEEVRSGVERIKKVLADNGYYQSSITYELTPHEDTRQMDVSFEVVQGPVARVGTVAIHGETGIPPEKIAKVTKLKAGAKVSASHLSRALGRLRDYYQRNNHLEAQVQLTDRQYHQDTNLLDYTFSADEGSRVLIVADGEKISQRQLKKLVPVYQENTVDDDLLTEGRRNIRNYLQTEGYFDATVEFSRREDASKDLVNIVYTITPGERHKLAAIEIEGNRYFNTATIRERMSITPSTWVVANGRFSQKMLTDDVANIKNLYLNNGFMAVKVEGGLISDYKGNKIDIAARIKIDEGPQTFVGQLTLTGNKSFDSRWLLPLLSNQTGQPYSEANLISDRDAITLFYYNNGFPDVQFEALPAAAPGDPLRENLVYTISEGQKVDVDRVITTGLEYTRPYIVDRQMRIHSGDPLNQTAMVGTQRRLYNLGIFNEVNMAVQNPDGEAPLKDVLFDLTEAKRWTFRYGGGIEFATGNLPSTSNPQGKTGVSPNGVLEITRLNMFGKDQTLTFRGRLGLLTRRALVSYDAPRLFRKENWRVNFSAFYDNTADVNTFASERLEGSIQAEQRYNRFTTLLYRMSYQRVRVDPNSLVIDPNLIPIYSQPVRISMPSFTYIRDKRDSPIESTRGSYTAWDVGIATSALGGQSNFTRTLLDNASYYTIKKKWVLARRTQIGIERPYGTNFYGTGSPETAVPLPELFFAGGSNSLRGFSINQAGPRDPDSGYAIGGQGLFVNNLELRTPPVDLPFVGNNIGFVLFHDMGNVFSSANEILSGIGRLHQPSLAPCAPPDSTLPCNFSYNPQAIGTGIRYHTPIGPVRLDLSYNFNPTRYPIREEARVTTLRHWNFFFSIGQTF